MADILVTDVTYTHLGSQPSGIGRIRRAVQITFPTDAGRLDYPAGGVPLTVNQLGFPKGVGSVQVVGRTTVAADANPIWVWNGDTAAPKLLAYASRTITKQDAELSTAANDKALTQNGQVLTLLVDGQ